MLKFISKHWKIITGVSVFLNVILGYLLQHYYFLSNQRTELLSLAYNTSPSFSLKYERNPESNLYFSLKYYGPSELEDFWIEENVYLLSDDTVRECSDAPRFQYLYYRGNPRSMGKLSPMEEKKIKLSECWTEFMGRLVSNFKGNLISRFVIRGSSPNSPEFRQERYFWIDVRNKDYRPIEEITAGEKMKMRVQRYNSEGPRSVIKWVPFKSAFLVDPPKYWDFDKNKDLKAWLGKSLASPKGKRVSAIVFPDIDAYAISIQEGQSVKLVWDCEESLSLGVEFSGEPTDL